MSQPTSAEITAPEQPIVASWKASLSHTAENRPLPVTPLPSGERGNREGPPRGGRRLLVGGGVIALALTGALAAGTLPRLRQEEKINAAAAEVAAAKPRVTVAVARAAPAQTERVLPGNSLPLLEASLYARATGYIKSRLADIGDRVEEGQLLAVIDSPDIDDQLAQAKANLAQSKANLKLAQANRRLADITYQRDVTLGASVAPQQLDQDRAAAQSAAAQVEAARASIKVNEAAVQRLTDLQNFEKIIAPFPGVITARRIEKGDLVNADSSNRELFHLMRTDTLRVFVNVPQVYATGIRVGQEALVYRRESPQEQFTGKVTRTADALESNTRTLLTEVQVHNPDGRLRPGMYLEVKFLFRRGVSPTLIPSAALTIRADGPRVAVLDAAGRVQYRKVQLGRDFGADIEVLAGLKAGAVVVVRPGDDLPAGTLVDTVSMQK